MNPLEREINPGEACERVKITMCVCVCVHTRTHEKRGERAGGKWKKDQNP